MRPVGPGRAAAAGADAAGALGRRVFGPLWLLALSLLPVACADIGSRPDAALTGSVTLATAAALPADARLRVTLLAAGADGALDPIAEVEMITERLPVAFELRYDPRAIDAAQRYLLQATLTGNGLLLMLTEEPYPVLTLGNPQTVELELHPAGS